MRQENKYMENKYEEYIEEKGTHFPTSIHTKISDKYRVSTIYRKASITQPMYYWETFVWDGDKIHESTSHYTLEGVLNYHYLMYFELGGVWIW